MGRTHTGTATARGSMRLEMSHFKNRIPQLDGVVTSRMQWNNGNNIGYRVTRNGQKITLSLNYTINKDGGEQSISYDILITTKPSNLGKGVIYQFICPVDGNPCNILYMAHGSRYFMSRAAYERRKARIYYPTQLSGYYDKSNDNYWHLDSLIKELEKKHPKSHYRGAVTKPQVRLTRLRGKQVLYDALRWRILPVKLRRVMPFFDNSI